MYDLVVVGSGPGGYVAAIRAAELGLKTACIEKDPKLGGTCLNVGCIPSKALLYSSELYSRACYKMKAYGIDVGSPRVDFDQMMKRKQGVVSGFNQGIETLFKMHKVDWIRGVAKLQGSKVFVDGKEVPSKWVLLATGSEPSPLPFLPFDEKKVLSSTGALSLQKVPKKMLVIGAGIIGVELGSVYQRLGAEVTLIEFLDRICPAFDGSLSTALQKSLGTQGMKFHLSHKVLSAQVGSEVVLKTDKGDFQGDVVLVAVGRRPNSKDLSLDKDPKGFVRVDASFRTSEPNVFAIGDLIDGPMLAHKASEEGTAVAEMLAGKSPSIDYATIPNVAYTDPEVAAVGFTEEELKQRGISYVASQASFKVNSRAKCTGEEEGFAKILSEKSTGKILGVHMIGPHVSELIAEAVFALKTRATKDELFHTCHAHPTLAEILKEAAAK